MLVIGVCAYMTQPGAWESSGGDAADACYNLLVQGFRAGQLSLKKEVPPGLARLADPYDPAANAPYRAPPYWLHDLSYYKGRLYLYFGVTPALVLFWPYVALTGHYLFQSQTVTIFCGMGFLTSVWLLHALWRRYFAEVSLAVLAACALALGLATGVPMLLSRSDVYEVSISCGYMLTTLALAAIWCALHEPERRWRWLAMASVAYGLAVGARPSLLFGAIILLVPVAQTWRERRPIGPTVMAAIGPILLIGLGLMLYNAMRFDNPLEFGQHYQLAGERQDTIQFFSLHYLWFNFRVYFLEPARWRDRFPFVHEIAVPALPAGHGRFESPYGVLSNIPLVWLALAVPLAWRSRSVETRPILHGFFAAVAMLFGICALTISFFWSTCIRYEVEFLPPLVWLAVVGILGLERALLHRAAWRRAVRWGWGLLLGFSLVFNLLASVEYSVKFHNDLGAVLQRWGRTQEAIGHFEKALRMEPDYAEAHCNLGAVLGQAGRLQEAIAHYEQALRIKPDIAVAHNNLAGALLKAGNVEDAIRHYREALRLMPDSAVVHYNLGNTLLQAGQIKDAMQQYEQALHLNPGYAEAQDALARLRASQ